MSRFNIFLFISSVAIAAAVSMHLIPANSPEQKLAEQAIKAETGLDVSLSSTK